MIEISQFIIIINWGSNRQVVMKWIIDGSGIMKAEWWWNGGEIIDKMVIKRQNDDGMVVDRDRMMVEWWRNYW